VAKNRKVVAPKLTSAQIQQLAQGMAPIQNEEAVRGQERFPIASIRHPAAARFPKHGANLIKACAGRRSLESDFPAALRFHKTGISTILAAEPLAKFDPHATDQHELKWSDDNVSALMDMLLILQPRNMEVAEGFVMEMPIALEQVGQQWFLLFHLADAVTRVEEEGPPRKKKTGEASGDKNKGDKSGNRGEGDRDSSESQSAAGAQEDEEEQ